MLFGKWMCMGKCSHFTPRFQQGPKKKSGKCKTDATNECMQWSRKGGKTLVWIGKHQAECKRNGIVIKCWSRNRFHPEAVWKFRLGSVYRIQSISVGSVALGGLIVLCFEIEKEFYCSSGIPDINFITVSEFQRGKFEPVSFHGEITFMISNFVKYCILCILISFDPDGNHLQSYSASADNTYSNSFLFVREFI